MAILDSLNTSAPEAVDAVVAHLGTDSFIIEGGAKLTAEHLVLEPLAESDDYDAAWSWRLAEAAPVVRDGGGEVIVIEGREARTGRDDERNRLTRGVVVEFSDYGGFVVVTDTDGEDDEALVEQALGMHPDALSR